ncbi:MAG: adenine-specific methyltransferase EcoRI family protein [Sphaerochaetaceae bacterium]|nr:adenine-specific methyltransferase EcoRI family protein [Spirochaetales bacterium]MDY3768131.1 adenine-specific methyltransferase EcoRI family protein [Sphaerochaetaceae bacterium]MDY5967685.1 adenine-specific methyltransferase EcoRI family protein [Sphaerochaetaceae bacterium]
MTRKCNHSLLEKAKYNKKDEFYTQLIDIENELSYYEEAFFGKVVYCNCDDVKHSNFFKYFVSNFTKLGLKKLICACYKESSLFNPQCGYYYEYNGSSSTELDLTKIKNFNGNGDFRSKESIALLKQADIVVTNPPFSLFREYISQLVEYKKKFLIISNVNAITYKEVYSLIKKNKLWLGVNLGRGISGFIVPKEYELYGLETKINKFGERIISPNNCMWLTNINHSKPRGFINLTERYIGNELKYPHYDNFDGIHIDKTKNIPYDYDGVMGVPLTFLHQFNPEQFEIIQFRKGDDGKDLKINGKAPFFRILVRNKKYIQNCNNKQTS